MSFGSILFDEAAAATEAPRLDAPGYFDDLHLDQVVESVTAGREEHDLAPFYCAPLPGVEAIAYRHEVFRELEHEDLSDCVGRFAEGMRAMRDQLARVDKLHYALQRQRWFLDAVGTYCGAVARLTQDLERMVSTIAADDPAVRTYKIERRPADGLAYAAVLAERHGLTYEALKDRIAS